jgi:deazaflavin-dependent oxidoreductase (nitroreductase family)
VATEPADESVVDSPTGWVARHIERYVASDGAKGHEFYGAPSLLLTTRGRKSGTLRRTALYYGKDGDRFVVVASNGGAREHPLWYRNVEADPAVHVQVGPDHYDGRARTATGEERARLWALMTGVYRTYDSYQRKTKREIPVVVIDVDG